MKNKRFKLRFYKLSGPEKGNLDHEEYFDTYNAMWDRYAQVFRRNLYALNPTGWVLNASGEYNRVQEIS